MKRIERVISAFTAAAVAAGTLAASASAASSVPTAKPFQPKEGAILGAATHFHLFAEKVTTTSHVHGNVATNLLSTTFDFGVRKEKLDKYESVNYIKDFDQSMNIQSLSTKLVVGADVQVDISNDEYVTLTSADGKTKAQVLKTSAGDVYKEGNEPYIDIAKELDNFAKESVAIAKEKNTVGIKLSYESNGDVLIDCSGAKKEYDGTHGNFMYYTLDLENERLYNALTGGSQMFIKGLDFDKGDFLYLTIDMADRADKTKEISFNKWWKVYKYNSDDVYPDGELPLSQGGGRILYNFVSSNGSTYKAYDGKLILAEGKTGSVMAPRATVDIEGNVNGTIIGKTINCNKESHRWDVQKEEEFPKKITTTTPGTDPEPEKTTSKTTASSKETSSSTSSSTKKPTETQKPQTSESTKPTSSVTTKPVTEPEQVVTTSKEAQSEEITTTTKAAESEEVTTTTKAAESEEVTTTTTVAGDNEEITTTTTYSEPVEDIKKEVEEIDDKDVAKIQELIEKIDKLLEDENLTDADKEELQRMRRVLGEKISVGGSSDELPNTGDGLGITLAILAAVTVAAAAVVGRKKLSVEDDDK